MSAKCCLKSRVGSLPHQFHTIRKTPGRHFILHPAPNGAGFPLLNRWPLPPIRKAIGLVSSAKPTLRLIFVCLGRGLPPTRPRPFYEICKAVPLYCRQSSIFDYSCFSLSTRRSGLLPASAIFKLCARHQQRPSSTFGQRRTCTPLAYLFASRQGRRWTQAGLSQMFTSRKDLPKYTPLAETKSVSICG